MMITVAVVDNPRGHKKRFTHPPVLLKAWGPAQTYAAYTYTVNGLPATVKDAKNNLTTYQYDGHDRKLKTLYPNPTTANTSSITDYEQYGFDANGNVVSVRKRNGQTVTLAYDNLNRLLTRSYPTTADNVSFGYDLLGRRLAANYANASYNVSYAWDNAGRLTSTTAGGKVLAYQYDPAGNRTRLDWPEGGFYVTTTYDALNRPTAIKELGVTNLATYGYDDLSRRTTVTLGNASTTTSYGYTTQSALASLGHNLTGTAQDNTWTYTRNQAQEIAGHSWNNDIYQWTGYTNGTRSYTPNGLNQYTAAAGATLGYDANGNLTGDGVWTYTYDTDNRLKSANKTGLASTLAYDAEGRLRQTVIAGATTNLAYDGADLVAEYDSAGTLLRRYVHGPGVDEPLVWYEGTGTANKSWLYADHLGSIVATASSAGTSTATYTYGPYGEPNVTTGSRFRYTGQQLLGQLNLYYYKARFYSPAIGRFLQTDPIGYADDMNLYAYVRNNPINLVDPDGKLAFFWHAGITYVAARDSGMGFVDSVSLAWNTMMADWGTQSTVAADANVHAMLGTDANGIYQSPAQGLQAINGIIANGSLPTAMHTSQDAATPDHYLEKWTGAGWNLETATHLLHDTFPSVDTIRNAYNNTLDALSNRANVGGMEPAAQLMGDGWK